MNNSADKIKKVTFHLNELERQTNETLDVLIEANVDKATIEDIGYFRKSLASHSFNVKCQLYGVEPMTPEQAEKLAEELKKREKDGKVVKMPTNTP